MATIFRVEREFELNFPWLEDLGREDINDSSGLDHPEEAIDEEEQHGDYEEVIVPDGMVDPEEGVEEIQVVHDEEHVVETATKDVEGRDPYNDRQYPRD